MRHTGPVTNFNCKFIASLFHAYSECMWPLITVKNDKHHWDAFTSEFTASRPKENERVRVRERERKTNTNEQVQKR